MVRPFHHSVLTAAALAVFASVGCGSSASNAAKSDGATGTSTNDFGDTPSCANKLTDYPGDCRAPPAIDPDVGVIAHYGPRDYDDPAEVAAYVMTPGYEGVDCVYSTLTNPADMFYQRYDVWSRPGTHHVILSADTSAVPDGTHDDCMLRDNGSALLAVVQGGIQGSVYHYPPSGKIAPENAALGTKLTAEQQIAYELHAINTTEEPLLKETWTAFYSMPASDVQATVGQMAFNGGLDMNVLPHTQQTITNSCALGSALGTVRVVDLFGHMHAHGQRFSAWHVTPSTGARTLIYESYDWSELDLIEFNTITTNPEIVYQGGKDGGASGDLTLAPGDRIDYECAVDNTTDASLRFTAQAFTGEMCNMFGSFTPGTYWSCLGD